MKRRWVRWVLGSLVAFLALTALAHTPAGLRAIAWVTGDDGCPFGHDKKQPPLTASAAEQRRVENVVRGSETRGPAPARPALGFTLDVDHRADVLAWTQRHSISSSCRADRSGAGLRCDHVDGAMLPSPLAGIGGVVSFGFDTADRLVSVTFQSASTTPKARVLEVAGTAMAGLEQLGATSSGDPMTARAFVRRETRATFSDYAATVVASNVGKRWMTMQTFQSIPKQTVASR